MTRARRLIAGGCGGRDAFHAAPIDVRTPMLLHPPIAPIIGPWEIANARSGTREHATSQPATRRTSGAASALASRRVQGDSLPDDALEDRARWSSAGPPVVKNRSR